MGEIDIATERRLRSALTDAIDRSWSSVIVVDFADVTFMDSSGYHALHDATMYARLRRCTLTIRNASRQVTKVLHLCDSRHELVLET